MGPDPGLQSGNSSRVASQRRTPQGTGESRVRAPRPRTVAVLCPRRVCGTVGAEGRGMQVRGPLRRRGGALRSGASRAAAGCGGRGGGAGRGGAQAAEPRDRAPRAGAALEPWPPTAPLSRDRNFPGSRAPGRWRRRRPNGRWGRRVSSDPEPAQTAAEPELRAPSAHQGGPGTPGGQAPAADEECGAAARAARALSRGCPVPRPTRRRSPRR